jgi:hypothetical protein
VSPRVFTELETSTVNPAYAVAFAVEFLVWWHQAGRCYYGWGARKEDAGLIALVNDAVTAVGGWQAARRVIRSDREVRSS